MLEGMVCLFLSSIHPDLCKIGQCSNTDCKKVCADVGPCAMLQTGTVETIGKDAIDFWVQHMLDQERVVKDEHVRVGTNHPIVAGKPSL